MTATVSNEMGAPTTDIEKAVHNTQKTDIVPAVLVSFGQECTDFALHYPFRAFLIRVVLLVLFIRVLLDVILEIYMIKTAYSLPPGTHGITSP